MCKIIDKAILQDGTKIQLEDWTEYNLEKYPNLYGLVLAAYPIAKNTSKYGWISGGKTFRLSIGHNKYTNYTGNKIKNDYELIKNGNKTLLELSDHYDDKRDLYYMGITNIDPESIIS